MASASRASRRPVSRCVRAAAFLIQITASTNGASGARWEMGKFWRARSVWTPYSASADTASSPRGSRSTRVALIASVRSLRTPSVSSQESPMELTDFIQHLPSRAAFAPDKMTKLDCFRSPRLLVGLNCFEAGQSQPIHAHAGADKFYLVVSGKASFGVAVGPDGVGRAGALEPPPPPAFRPLAGRARPPLLHRLDQVVTGSLLSCQDSVGVESVAALVEMGDAHPQQLLQEGRHGSL